MARGVGGELSVAAVNGPRQVVVAGTARACEQFAAAHEAQGARRIAVDYASHTVQVAAVQDRLAVDLAGLAPVSGSVPFHSTVEGGLVGTAGLDGGYWFRNLREPVRFGEVIAALVEQGHRSFVEVSPHPVLGMAVAQAGEDLAVLGSLHRGDGGRARWLQALASAWVAGAAVDWATVTAAGGRGRKVALPTYPFQRQRYWPRPAGRGDALSAGQQRAGHPLLAAAVWLADGDGLVLTGRLSLAAAPWLADHAVHGTTLLAGTAFLDLAVHAGDLAGCRQVEELTLQEPLLLPASGGVQVQVHVGTVGEDGRRAVTISSRPEDGTSAPGPQEDGGWTRHAAGTLAPAGAEPAPAPLGQWPPAGAEPVPAGDAYERLAGRGYGYGPAFQGLRRAWRAGDTVYAEAELPQAAEADAAGFGLHPALLDAALHSLLTVSRMTAVTAAVTARPGGGAGLPFAWSGVRLLAGGARHLRVVLVPGPGGIAVTAFDGAGQPVLVARSLALREVGAGQLGRGGPRWPASRCSPWAGPRCPPRRPRLPRSGGPGSASRPTPPGQKPPRWSSRWSRRPVRETRRRWRRGRRPGLVLGWVQQWLADPGSEAGRLVVWVQGAAAGRDLAAAAVAGLVRSAQSEHPGRLLLVDVDPGAGLDPARDADVAAVLALALDAGEPEVRISVRCRRRPWLAFGRRLARAGAGAGELALPSWRGVAGGGGRAG